MANILLVEDEDQLRSLLKEVLESEGHAVWDAENGKTATSLLASFPIDLIITDLIMPEKEGLELILEIRRSHPEIKVIAMSGGGRSNPQDYLEMAKRFGAKAVLSKPFTNEAIIDAVNNLK